jgi:hypothetical protein
MGTVGILDIPNQVTCAAIEPVAPIVATTDPVLVVQAISGTTGDVEVTANDDTQLILIAGDYLSSSRLVLGASVAEISLNRTVTAQVGTAAEGPPLISSLSGIGDMNVTATADGFVLPIALAGAGPADGAGGAHGDAHGIDHHNPPTEGSASVPGASAFGLGFSGDAAVAVVNDTVQAFINDGGTLTGSGGKLSVTSADQTSVAASTGAWSSLYGEHDGLSAGLAGSVSLTFVNANVQAFLNGPTVDNLGLQVLATNSMLVGALAAGGSGSSLPNSLAVAGSVAYNDITFNTQASLNDVTGTNLAAVEVQASNQARVWAAAGSVDLVIPKITAEGHDAEGQKRIGIGLAAAWNGLNNTTTATISNSSLTQASGGVELVAEDNSRSYAFAAGVAATEGGVALGGQFTNTDANYAVTAEVADSTITSTATGSQAGLTVAATMSPVAISGAGNLMYDYVVEGTAYVSAGAAVTNLTVNGSATAQITGSTVNLANGGVNVVTISGPPPEDPDQATALENLNLPLSSSSNNFYSFAVGADISNAMATGEFSLTFNDIQSWNLTAQITDSTVTAGGDLAVEASDNSEIIAGAGSLAVVSSANVELQAAFGAAVAKNTFVGNTTAQIVDSAVTGNGTDSDLTVSASSDRLISTGAAGGQGGGAVDAGTAITLNTIDSTVTAQIAGTSSSPTTVTTTGDILVAASDASTIGAGAGQIDLSFLMAKTDPPVSVAAAAAATVNTVNQSVSASVDTATLNAPTGSIEVTAEADSSLTANAVGVAFTLSSATLIFGLDGAGSGASNTLTSSVLAEVVDSTVHAGSLSVEATDNSTIQASAGTVAIQALVSTQGANLSAAVGVSIAENTLGSASTPNQVVAQVVDSTLTLSGANAQGAALAITAESTVNATAATAAGAGDFGVQPQLPWTGVGAQSLNTVYENVSAELSGGQTTVTGAGDVLLTAQNSSTHSAGAGGVAFAGYTAGESVHKKSTLAAVSVGAALASNEVTLQTSALVTDAANVTFAPSAGLTAGDLMVAATADAVIEAVAVGVAGTLALGTSTTLSALDGAGSSAVNSTNSTVVAQVTDSGTTVQGAGAATITARDQNQVTAGSGALAFTGGTKIQVASSVGVSLSENTVTGSVTAGVENASLTASGPAVIAASLEPASSQGNAFAVAVAGTGVFGFEGGPLVAAGAGAGTTNTVNYTVLATVENSVLATGSLELSATDNSVVYSNAGGVGLAAATAEDGFQATMAVGAAQGTNSISSDVQAAVSNSTVTTSGDLTVAADSQANIDSIGYGVALGLEFADAGLSSAGSGAAAYNTTQNSTIAHITGGTVTVNGNNSLTVAATDAAQISVGAGSGSLSVAVGEGAALAVGTVIAQNALNNTTEAYVGTLTPASGSTPPATTVSSSGPIAVTAMSTPTISADVVAVATALDVGASFAGAGAGGNATTTLGPSSVGGVQVLAGIVAGAEVTTTAQPAAGPALLVEATYQPTVTVEVGTGTFSGSFVGSSVGVSLGTITDNTTVQSLIQSASVSAPLGTVEVATSSRSNLESQVVPTAQSLALGLGSATGVSTIDDNAQYLASVTNAQAISAQTLAVQAQSQDSLDALTQGGAGGLAAVGVFVANATRGGSTLAQVELPATLSVSNLTIAAQTNQAVLTNSYSVTIGLDAGAGQNINSTLTENVQAQLLNPLNQAYTLGGPGLGRRSVDQQCLGRNRPGVGYGVALWGGSLPGNGHRPAQRGGGAAGQPHRPGRYRSLGRGQQPGRRACEIGVWVTHRRGGDHRDHQQFPHGGHHGRRNAFLRRGPQARCGQHQHLQRGRRQQ